MDGTIIYTLFYSISKVVRVAKDEVIRPVRSAPLYEENFLRFKVIRDPVMHEVNGRRIVFDLKIFENSNLIIEAQIPLDPNVAGNIPLLKSMLFEECRKLAQEFDPSAFFEEYIFFCIKNYNGTIDSYLSEHGEQIAGMLKDESIQLAQKEIDDTLASNIRYGRNDITIVDWDGAFLIDDSGEFKETIALLELANIQLLNFRILDKKLAEKIDMLKQHSEPDLGSFFRISPFMKNIIRIRSQSVLELQNIESTITLYGDWYSGKLYELANKKFHLSAWREQVEAKLQVLGDLYEMVEHVMTERFNLILEFLIVILIVLEILMALLRK